MTQQRNIRQIKNLNEPTSRPSVKILIKAANDKKVSITIIAY